MVYHIGNVAILLRMCVMGATPMICYLKMMLMENHLLKQRLLSNIISFDYNSMKLGHINKYHNVFKFQNGPYRIMPSGVIALFVNDNSLFIYFPISSLSSLFQNGNFS